MNTAVLLLAHGTPDTVSQIPEYMRNVTSGRPIPDSVIEEVAHRYSMIGHSPLTEITLRQGQLLSKLLKMPVYVGMRNWRPYIAETVKRMRADDVARVFWACPDAVVLTGRDAYEDDVLMRALGPEHFERQDVPGRLCLWTPRRAVTAAAQEAR